MSEKISLSFRQGHLEKALQSNHLADVVFVVGPDDEKAEQLHAHRTILALNSPVFAEQLLSGKWKESQDDEVRLTQWTAPAFRLLLHLLYIGHVPAKNIAPRHVMELSCMADYYQLGASVSSGLASLFTNSLSPSAVCTLLMQSLRLGSPSRAADCWLYIVQNLEDVLNAAPKKWAELPFEEMQAFASLGADEKSDDHRMLVPADTPAVVTEELMLQAIVLWGTQGKVLLNTDNAVNVKASISGQRKKQMKTLGRRLRLCLLSAEVLTLWLAPCEIVPAYQVLLAVSYLAAMDGAPSDAGNTPANALAFLRKLGVVHNTPRLSMPELDLQKLASVTLKFNQQPGYGRQQQAQNLDIKTYVVEDEDNQMRGGQVAANVVKFKFRGNVGLRLVSFQMQHSPPALVFEVKQGNKWVETGELKAAEDNQHQQRMLRQYDAYDVFNASYFWFSTPKNMRVLSAREFRVRPKDSSRRCQQWHFLRIKLK